MIDEEQAGRTLPPRRGEEFLNLYRKVESFTRELLQENERLRYLNVALEQEVKSIKGQLAALPPPAAGVPAEVVETVSRLTREKEELVRRYKEVEQENVDFARRYVEIEAENNNLANLYVASYQLHSTLELKEVYQIVKEIIINLVGAETFAVLLVDQKKGEMPPVVIEGCGPADLPVIRIGEGAIGKSVLEGQGVYVAAEIQRGAPDFTRPLVSIPLRIKTETIGAIAIYGLLEHKKEFTPLDIELFNLLGGHAATAIFGAKLYSESKRKLTTIQGFLELLKPE
jgi:nitrate/nitrite-specific signal transduction histidine kinase